MTHERTWSGAALRMVACAAVLAVAAVAAVGVAPAPAAANTGYVTGWGPNQYGQANVPDDLGRVEALSAGYEHTVALQANGVVRAWGRDEAGETDVPGELEQVADVAAGLRHSLALHNDGTVTAWGANGAGQVDVPENLDGVTAVSAGRVHNLALRSDGTVTGWGSNTDGQLDVPDNMGPATDVAAGRTHSMAAIENGNVREWGSRSEYGDPEEDVVPRPEELPHIDAVAAGAGHSLALDEDGRVHAWGANHHGQADVPDDLENVVEVVAGFHHSVARTADGAAVAWGNTDTWWTGMVEGVSHIAAGFHTITVQDTPFANGDLVQRLSGDMRVTTAIDISRASFGDEAADVVVLARADDYPDALTGTALAVNAGGPLLLTFPDELLQPVDSEIRRVLPRGGTVYLLGGTAALDQQIAADLDGAGFDVQRISGETRFETAAQVAAYTAEPDEPVMIATGLDYPDALTAATGGGAVVLSAGDETHPATDEFLADAEGDRYAVGGPAGQAYPDAMELSGATREGTAVAFAEELFNGPRTFALARRDAFPDALAGGAHISRHGGPLLLSYSETLSEETADYLCAHQRDLRRGWVYGGIGAVSPDTRDHAADLIAEACTTPEG